MKFIWPETARSDLRAVDRDTAVRILHALTRYGETGEGDIKALTGEWHGYARLRIGHYRVILLPTSEEITIIRIRHRSDVYR